MPLGDSITWGEGSASTSSYRAPLYSRLVGAAGYAVDFVGSQRSGSLPDTDNEGHSGWRIDQIAASANGWLATYQPDVILLHIGTNDMFAGNAAAAPQLGRLLDRIHAARPFADVLVAQVIGLGRTPRTGGQLVRTAAYHHAVRQLVAARGPLFHLVDHTGIAGIDMVDRLHPNAFGFRRMAWNWYRALRPVLGAGAAWPAGDDPNRADFATRCLARTTTYPAELRGCRLWHRHGRVWQLPVLRTATVNGQQVTTVRWVAAR
jgi:lysophospholipase L1-like esterase